MPELIHDSHVIKYSVMHSRRRSLGIEITHDGRVLVRAPLRTAEWRTEGLVRDKAPWILKHLARTASYPPPREFAEGELFLYAGKEYRLRVFLDGVTPHVDIGPSEINAFVSPPAEGKPLRHNVRKTLLLWYGRRAVEMLSGRTADLARQTGLSPTKLGVRSQLHRWGSCSAKGSINLNWRLVMAPQSIADYVIIHELCHIREPNHSSKFWELVASFVPDYRTHRKWLKENCRLLEI
ncbi:MAG: SprT family zinc-dependent metalloprotease [Dehalococcoidia bacterium]|nr:SprT family zinc-dependent metalloprotease [Dehalococcoidia bacterium]